ncbi:hypothetical protein [Ideonella sp.]|uniref:hypothetical protein n=1 Tax=Ideonella sp. TaxID=1929293 RepID=UPI0037C18FB9
MAITRRRVLGGLVLATAGGLGACASVLGPRRVVYSEAELAALLAQRFPVDRRLMEWLDVEVSRPQVRLLPEDNRLELALGVALRDRLFTARLQGRLRLSTALAVRAEDRSLRMRQVRVHDWAVEGLEDTQRWPSRLQGQRLGGLLVERVLEDLSLYTFKDSDWQRLSDAGYAPPQVRIQPQGLELLALPRS